MSPRGPRLSSLPSHAESIPAWLSLAGNEPPLRWEDIFARQCPVELEIGCGNGRFLARAAAACPEHAFLGIEVSRKYALAAAQRLHKNDIGNARAAHAEAWEFLFRWTPPHSLAAVHIYFSDPWPKRRHSRRRLFQWPFLQLLAEALLPAAPLFIKTDVDWYFAEIATLFIEHDAFAVEEYGRQTEFPGEDMEMTGFESKARRQEREVYCLNLRRREDRPA